MKERKKRVERNRVGERRKERRNLGGIYSIGMAGGGAVLVRSCC